MAFYAIVSVVFAFLWILWILEWGLLGVDVPSPDFVVVSSARVHAVCV